MLFAHFHVLPIVCMYYFCPEFVWAEGIQLSLLLFLLKKNVLKVYETSSKFKLGEQCDIFEEIVGKQRKNNTTALFQARSNFCKLLLSLSSCPL